MVWNWHRCQGIPLSVADRAAFRPAWSSLTTSLTPRIPIASKAFQELSPVWLSFAHGNAAAENRVFPAWRNADGREDGTRHHGPAVSDFFVSGIEDEVVDFAEWPVSPSTQLLVQFGCRSADLR